MTHKPAFDVPPFLTSPTQPAAHTGEPAVATVYADGLQGLTVRGGVAKLEFFEAELVAATGDATTGGAPAGSGARERTRPVLRVALPVGALRELSMLLDKARAQMGGSVSPSVVGAEAGAPPTTVQ